MPRNGKRAAKPDAKKDQKPTEGAAEEVVETEEVSSEEPVNEEEEVLEDNGVEEPEGEVPVEEPQKGLALQADPKVKGKKPKKMFKIIIDEQDNDDKNGDVKCTDGQGTQYSIKRGHEVDVPEGVVNVLKESVYERIEEDEHGNERKRHIPRYAMRIIKEL